MHTVRRWFGVALLTVSAMTAAAEPYAIGGRTLKLPAASGFVRVSDSLPDTFRIFETYLPAESRLIDAYLDSADHARLAAGEPGELARYCLLAVQRVTEGKPLSIAGFRTNMAALEAALAEAMPSTAEITKEQFRKSNAAAKERTGTDPNVSIADVGYHGIHRRENWGLFFTSTMEVNSTGTKDRIVTATAFALIDHQLMYFNVYAQDRSIADRKWTKETLNAWVEATRQANPDDLSLEVRSLFGLGQIDRGGLIVAAILLVAGAVVVILILRNRRRQSARPRLRRDR
jgi:hypothetical protein